MRNILLLFCFLLGWPAAGAELQLNFGDVATSGGLTNFHAVLLGGGAPAVWQILPGEAPSAFGSAKQGDSGSGGGSVLAQTSQDPTDERFLMYIYEGEKFRNFRLTTRFKVVSGVTEQMAGIVFRYRNPTNFYVVRASVLGKNVRFYKVVDGVRSNPLGPACELATGTWHALTVQCEGNHITLWLDGHALMATLNDNSFDEGKIGFWTKSDSVSYFAGATIAYTPVIPAAQVLVNNLLAKQPRILGLQVYVLDGTNNTTSIIASKDPSERGQPGAEAELAAIQNGTVSYGRDRDAVLVTMPLHDRNGEYIAAVRLKLKSFFGETQNNALMRAKILLNKLEEICPSAADFQK